MNSSFIKNLFVWFIIFASLMGAYQILSDGKKNKTEIQYSEFLNRLDDVILFNHLTKNDTQKIINIELQKVIHRIQALNYNISLTKKVINYLAEKGFDEKFGARPLKRAIQKYIEDVLAEQIISNKLKEGDKIQLDLKDDQIIIKKK